MNSVSHLLTTTLVDYSNGIYNLKKQRKLYKKIPCLNPEPKTITNGMNVELILKSRFSPNTVRKHEKLFETLYSIFPSLLPNIVDCKVKKGVTLYQESALTPLQLNKLTTKTRLALEHMIKISNKN